MKLPFSSRQQQRAAGLAAFAAFDATRWSNWIQGFAFHDRVEPEIPVYEEQYSLALIDLYKELPAPSRLHFARGLAQAFEALPLTQVNGEQILLMLDVIAVVKPIESRPFLRRHLRAGTLRMITYEGIRLHTILLGATGKYSVDPELVELIESTLPEESDFSWWLAGFRILSYSDVALACGFLERMLPLLESANQDVVREREVNIEEELKSLVRREKARGLWFWYTSRRKELASAPGFERFSTILVDRVLPSARRARQDSYALIADKVLNAERRELNIADIQEIAGLYDRVPQEELVSAMRLLFETAKDRAGEEPWQLLDHDQWPYDRIYPKEERGGVSLIATDTKDKIWFSKERDRRLLQIIEKATPDYGDPMVDIPASAGPEESKWVV